MVKAYAEMIRDLSGDNPVKREEHINIIIEESDRLAALVNDILDLSKLENGSAELNLSEFCINDKIADVMTRYTLLSEQQGYKFYIGECTDVIVKADIIKIEQVLYNLINNAVNYSGDGKEIYIMEIIHGQKVRISVTDTGPGIEKELMPLIFDRYYRAEKHKREVIGTGLGLSIVKQILIRHGFDFGVQSELGTGSTFWFEMDIVSDAFGEDEIEIVD
jgi:signal transduction histidine kinase